MNWESSKQRLANATTLANIISNISKKVNNDFRKTSRCVRPGLRLSKTGKYFCNPPEILFLWGTIHHISNINLPNYKFSACINGIFLLSLVQINVEYAREVRRMVSYNKLWKLLIDKQMKKKDLGDTAGVNANTIAKMGKNELVSLEV